ncbi:hypothetical protein HD806DRAFT_495044 [Xylariaceae sp. AK1471]|nr:hypothetical protein HD806DRAFT_495044 [Xylariaceae sp. AK1471]
MNARPLWTTYSLAIPSLSVLLKGARPSKIHVANCLSLGIRCRSAASKASLNCVSISDKKMQRHGQRAMQKSSSSGPS